MCGGTVALIEGGHSGQQPKGITFAVSGRRGENFT